MSRARPWRWTVVEPITKRIRIRKFFQQEISPIRPDRGNSNLENGSNADGVAAVDRDMLAGDV